MAVVRHPAALEEDCRLADILIARFTIGSSCKAPRVVIDRRALKQGGAHALYLDGLSIRSENATEARGRRPWVPEREIAAKPRAPPGSLFARGLDEEGDAEEQRLEGGPED